jgi:hypothetical protein
VDSGIGQLKYFLGKYKDDGKNEINTICSAHTLTMDLDTKGKFNYCGCEVSPTGQLVIIFKEGRLGSNIHEALSEDALNKALNAAPQGENAVSYTARQGIKTSYEPEIGKVQEKINSLLQTEITLEPNFEENFAKLKAAPDSYAPWEKNLGRCTKDYFNAVATWLEQKKFGSDEMLREGLTEAVEKKVFKLRIVEQSQMKKTWNESVIEDGVLYMQVC